MIQTDKLSRNNTTLRIDGDYLVMSLHGSGLARVALSGECVELTDAGYPSVTTQTRLNQFCNELELDVSYSRARGSTGFYRLVSRTTRVGWRIVKIPQAVIHNEGNTQHLALIDTSDICGTIQHRVRELARRWGEWFGDRVKEATNAKG